MIGRSHWSLGRRVLLPLLLLAAAVQAQTQPEFTARGLLSLDKLAPGTRFRLAVVLDLPAPWHVNANPASDPDLIPTTLDWQAPATVVFEPVTYPTGRPTKADWAEKPVALYAGRVLFLANARLRDDAPPGPVRIEGRLRYQACNDQSCFAPRTIPVVIETTVVAPRALPQPAHPEIFGNAIAPGVTEAGAPGAETNAIESLIRQRGLALALFFVFLGGLALNATPCVYPMIAITVSYFGGQDERTVGRAFGRALVYCSGIVLTYSALGLVAALTGGLFGALLQSPVVLVVIALLLVALALSMFGLYEIQPPQFLMQGATGLSTKAGALGLFFLGATVGVIAAPCVAPILVALLVFVGQRGDPWIGWWFFFALASGLGLPYVVLGTFSGLLTRLPKSGLWMVWVKRVFGVGLVAVAVWILSPLWSRQEPLDPAGITAQLAAARAAHQPVLLDFFAAWCGPCKEMDRLTFPDPRVQERLRKFAFIKVDLTRTGSPAVDELTRRYGIVGVPTYIFLDAAGIERKDLRTIGFTPADEFANRLDRALAPAPTNGPGSSSAAPDSPAELMRPF